ncbi:MAG: hypothetical protein H7338_25425 [Candidatus Sericytochromatia bacterium]|nr:hypothetical protein [Candidatus Sericytochromatia bacterium]
MSNWQRLLRQGGKVGRALVAALATVFLADACQRPTAGPPIPAAWFGAYVLPTQSGYVVPTQSVTSTAPVAGPAAVAHGAFVGDAPDRKTIRRRIADFEGLVGKKLGIVHLFIPVAAGFPQAACDEIRAGGAMPLISIAFAGDKSLDPILDGTNDAAFRTFVTDAAAWGSPILLRWGWEMNGGHAWSGLRNGGADGGPARYVTAWKRLRALAGGLPNLTWVWCPDAWGLGPDEVWNDPGFYYPGSDQVDWLGVDGYGWRVSSDNLPLAIFNGVRLAGNLLSRFQQTGKPIIIAETAADRTDEQGAAWTASLWQDLARVKNLKAICWFNRDQDGSYWALEADKPVTASYRSGVAGPHIWAPPGNPPAFHPPAPAASPAPYVPPVFMSVWRRGTIWLPSGPRQTSPHW